METNKISRAEIAKHSGITWKDILFYCFGDFGNCLIFAVANVLLTKYYNDCLLFNPVYVIIIFVIARVWDAINDPIMGRIADRMKPNKHGKFKRWFLYISFPYAIATVLMVIQQGGFVGANVPWHAYVIAAVTYICFGMCMTAIQIPYGSLASVVTLDAKERGKLSIARGVAGNLGGLPVLIVKAFAFDFDPTTGKDVRWLPLVIGVAILAVFSIVFMLLCYYGTKERVTPKEVPHEKGAFRKAIKRITGNRAMLSLCIIAVIVAGGGMFNSVVSVFVSMDFFGAKGVGTILPDIFDGLGIVFTIFLVPLFMKKFGKKESVSMGLLFATAIQVVQIFIVLMDRSNQGPYILYVTTKFLCGLGAGFFNSLLWGMVADCCDDIQIKTGIREDGTTYSILMFSRKIGQCIAFVLGQVILLVINYYGFKKMGQKLDVGAQNMLFLLATIIPLCCYGAGALLFIFWYPINKRRLEEIEDAKEAMLEKEAKAKQVTAKAKKPVKRLAKAK